MPLRISERARVPDHLGYSRLDVAAAQLFPAYSRSRLQAWIANGMLTVDGRTLRPRDKLVGGEEIVIDAEVESSEEHEGQPIELPIAFEDDHLLVVVKPAGLVTHPAPGHRDETLLNGLLHHAPGLRDLPRAGIVHRLDMGTTGLLVVAKSLVAHTHLVEQLQRREITRQYEAVVYGVCESRGMVDLPIGRHRRNRLKMAVRDDGREARTHYSVRTMYRAHTRLTIRLETGRTHQIRVHMSHIGFPLVGDPLYGGTLKLPRKGALELAAILKGFSRPALHAARLELEHPVTGDWMQWEEPLPEDMRSLIAALENDLRDET